MLYFLQLQKSDKKVSKQNFGFVPILTIDTVFDKWRIDFALYQTGIFKFF